MDRILPISTDTSLRTVRTDGCSSLHDIASRKPTEVHGQQLLQHSTVQYEYNNERLKGFDLLRKE